MVNSSPTGKANNNNLWLASLGLTEQLLRDKIEMYADTTFKARLTNPDRHKYLTDASVLQKAVSSINPLESEQVDQGSQLKVGQATPFRLTPATRSTVIRTLSLIYSGTGHSSTRCATAGACAYYHSFLIAPQICCITAWYLAETRQGSSQRDVRSDGCFTGHV